MPDMLSPGSPSDGEVSSSSRRIKGGAETRVHKEFGTVHNPCVDGLLTDFYQITMAYAYWKNGKHEENSVFDAYFRKCPFKGEYCIVGGINEVVRFLNTFGYSPNQIRYLQAQMPHVDPRFFNYLSRLDASELVVYGIFLFRTFFRSVAFSTFGHPHDIDLEVQPFHIILYGQLQTAMMSTVSEISRYARRGNRLPIAAAAAIGGAVDRLSTFRDHHPEPSELSVPDNNERRTIPTGCNQLENWDTTGLDRNGDSQSAGSRRSAVGFQVLVSGGFRLHLEC